MSENFVDSAKGLAKNPLGIIALFISFVYALACIVIGVSTNALNTEERMPLVYFIVAFPVLTLGCFMWLVISHPTKLYAPSDYKEDNSFMMTMGVPDSLKGFMNLPTVNAAQPEDPIVSLLNSSITGIFFLYAAHLAKQHGRTFTLDTLHSVCSILVPSYTHGFLVAVASVGGIVLESTDPFHIVSLNENIDNNIKDRIYQIVADATDKDDLFQQVRNLEEAFSAAIVDNSEPS